MHKYPSSFQPTVFGYSMLHTREYVNNFKEMLYEALEGFYFYKRNHLWKNSGT